MCGVAGESRSSELRLTKQADGGAGDGEAPDVPANDEPAADRPEANEQAPLAELPNHAQ